MGEKSNIGKLYFKKKLKWYEKIWYFITRKKNDYIELGQATTISFEEDN